MQITINIPDTLFTVLTKVSEMRNEDKEVLLIKYITKGASDELTTLETAKWLIDNIKKNKSKED